MNPDERTLEAIQLGARLRKLRTDRNLSLEDVSRAFGGAIKAVVLSSYERGDRMMSAIRCLELARLYNVPASVILEPEVRMAPAASKTLMVDLRKLRSTYNQSLAIAPFISRIITKRGDWNGEVLSLRTGDIETMGHILGLENYQARALLEERKVLFIGQDQI